jgi:hypothetical protein
MEPKSLDLLSCRVRSLAVTFGDDPRLNRSRTDIVSDDHVPSAQLLSKQLEAGEHKVVRLVVGRLSLPR